jgi:uncharacterized Zn-finger protein
MNASFASENSIATYDPDQKFNFKCKYCFRNLSSRQNLREHTYIHTGERPYICTETGCNQKFRQGSLLSIHRKIHSEINRNKKFERTVESKTNYLRLTQMIQANNQILESSLEESEKNAWKMKIGQQNFCFVLKFLNNI